MTHSKVSEKKCESCKVETVKAAKFCQRCRCKKYYQDHKEDLAIKRKNKGKRIIKVL